MKLQWNNQCCLCHNDLSWVQIERRYFTGFNSYPVCADCYGGLEHNRMLDLIRVPLIEDSQIYVTGSDLLNGRLAAELRAGIAPDYEPVFNLDGRVEEVL